MNFEDYLKQTGEIGYVESVVGPIAYASGLPGARREEIVMFEDGELGQILSLAESLCEILTFSKIPIRLASRVVRTGNYLEIATGNTLLGQIIDPFGKSFTEAHAQKPKEYRQVQIAPLGITARKTIKKHLVTGVTVVDLLIPIGHGQRELIMGDRKTGKTNFLLQAILSQAKSGNVCVYALIGKRKFDIKKVEELFRKNKVLDKIVIVASSSDDPLGSIYLTPYSAMTIAEFFRDQGIDTLLVLDDLSTHAKFYRELSLLGGRFPGRNSYPADIFHVHAQLLERGGNFAIGKGETSITVLPIAETTQGDLSGYIETNLMSMTDGHLYFDSSLFSQGRRPAINPFLSVTRVGQQTQSTLKRSIARELRSFLTLYNKTQRYIHFGEELSGGIKTILDMGNRINKFFHQPPSTITSKNIQIFLFAMVWANTWTDENFEKMKEDMERFTHLYEEDNNFRDRIDGIIQSSTHLNELLGKIRGIQTSNNKQISKTQISKSM